MMRSMMMLVGLLSFALLVAEGIAAGLLVARGQLTWETVTLVGDALMGELPEETPEAAAVAKSEEAVPASAETVARAASVRSLELAEQEKTLRLLRGLLAADSDRLRAEKAAFAAGQTQFRKELADLKLANTSEATEQARTILAALPARDAAVYLTESAEPDALRLLRGMPERNLAKILQALSGGTDQQQRRGKELFAALSTGEPTKGLIDAAQSAPAPDQPARE